MALPAADWLAILREDYLQDFIRDGGAAIKFAVGADEPERAALSTSLETLASEEGYLFAQVSAADVRLHMVDQLFFAVARTVPWEALAVQLVTRLLVAEGYQVPEEFGLAAIARANEREETLLRRDLSRWLEREIYADTLMARDFRLAMIRLCQAQLEPPEARAYMAGPVLAWLQGELRLLSLLKEAAIGQKITRHNARAMLCSLARWIRLVGRPGLVLVLDIARYAEAKRDPHSTPPSLLAFASQLADRMDRAKASPEYARALFDELASCAEDKAAAQLPTVRAICGVNAARLSEMHPDLTDAYKKLRAGLPESITDLMMASGY